MAEQVAHPDIKLPEVDMNIYSPREPVEVPVVENRIVTRESSPNFIRHVSFDISDTKLQGNIQLGQSFGILPPGKNEKGRPYKLRLYSLASPFEGEKGEGRIISTTVKRIIEEWEDQGRLYLGVCSNYLCNLKAGDKVKMTGPAGRRFLLPENRTDFNYVFFATGTGIAPYRGMVYDLLKEGVNSDIYLIFGTPYRTDILYEEFFRELEKTHDNFHFYVFVSREDRRADGTKKYVQYAIDDHQEELMPILKQENTLLYICGLEGMQAGIYRRLAHHGLFEYMNLKESVQGKSPDEWTKKDIKRRIKPGTRTFVEVY